MYDCNVVVIDDDLIILELLGIILEDVIAGEIVSFSDSTAALAYVKSNAMDRISLVICDWMMPQVSGLDILAALRQNKPECPFLMLTANATKELVLESMRLGASDFILKPFHTANKVERLIHEINID